MAVAKACQGHHDGFGCYHQDEILPAIQAALNSPNVALVEAMVDANAKPDDLKA